MSSREYATPLRLELRPSAILTRLVFTLYLSAFGMVLVAELVFWQKVLLVLGILASGVVHCLKYPLGHNKNRIRALVWHRGSAWQIEREGSIEAATLGSEGRVLAWLVVLQLKPETGGRLYLVLAPDMLDSDCFRQLRVRLRMMQTGR
jgi:hypothetical protein